MRGKILLLFLLSFIVLSSLAFSVDIDECYGFSENSTLTQNIYGDNTCMIAWADDITLDCDGYKITYGQGASGTRYGVDYTDHSNVNVQNCVFEAGPSGNAALYGLRGGGHVENVSIIQPNAASGIALSHGHFTLENITINSTSTTTSEYAGVLMSGFSDFIANNLRIYTAGKNYLGIKISTLQESDELNLTNTNITTTGTDAVAIVFNNALGKVNLIENVTIVTEKSVGLTMSGSAAGYFNLDIGENILFDGYPVLFNKSLSDQVVLAPGNYSENYGQVICALCDNVTYENITLSNDGLALFSTTNSYVNNLTVNTFSGPGIFLEDDSGGNYLRNIFVENAPSYGIYDSSTGSPYYNWLVYENVYGNMSWNSTNLDVAANLSLGETFFLEDNKIGLADLAGFSVLNTTTNITLKGLSYGSQPELHKNGVRCDDDESLCNITSWGDGVLVAQVASFSNYTTFLDETETVNLTLVGDARVAGGFPDTNFGLHSTLRVNYNTADTGSGYEYKSYVQFDEADVRYGQTIESADVCLNSSLAPKSKAMNVYNSSEFIENQITWNNQPCGAELVPSSDCHVLDSQTVPTTGQIYCWSITSWAAENYNTWGDISVVFAFPTTTGSSDSWQFNSRENEVVDPFLQVTYSENPDPPNATLVTVNDSYVADEDSVRFVVSWTDPGDAERAYICEDSSCTGCNSTDQTNCICYTTENDTYGTTNCDTSLTGLDAGSTTLWGSVCDTADHCDTTGLPSVSLFVESGPTVSAQSPANESYNETADPAEVTFNCSATDAFNLKNISLYLSNSTGGDFVFNDSASISGTSSYNEFTVNVSSGEYLWNCLAYDNFSLSDWGENRTFIANYTAPPTSSCGTLTESYTLESNVSSTGNCFTIESNNIVLDCDGYYINYSTAGTSGNGVYVTGSNNVTIKDCNIYEGNVSTNDKDAILLNFVENVSILNNTLVTIAQGSKGIAVAYSTFNTTVINNTINTALDSGVGLDVSYSVNTTAENNVINTVGAAIGIHISSSSYSEIYENNVTTTGSYGQGIVLSSSSNSTVQNNEIATYGSQAFGIYLVYASNNIVNSNLINTNESTSPLIYFSEISEDNLIQNNNLNYSLSDAFTFSGSGSSIPKNNNLSNNSLGEISGYDLNLISGGANGTYLMDQIISNYSFGNDGSLVYFKDTDYGEIKFVSLVTGSQINLSQDVQISNNSIYVNSSSNSGLNKSASIAIYGLNDYSYSPHLLMDGVRCDNTTYCNISWDGDLDILYANVSSFSNYTTENADTTPYFNPALANQTVEFGDSLSYQTYGVDDETSIDFYWLNDTSKFSINQSGFIENSSSLSLQNYSIGVYLNDSEGHNYHENITIFVEDTISPTFDNLANQSFTVGTALSTQFNVTDLSETITWGVNDTNFTIVSGLLVNVTVLDVGVYWININATDASDNSVEDNISVTVSAAGGGDDGGDSGGGGGGCTTCAKITEEEDEEEDIPEIKEIINDESGNYTEIELVDNSKMTFYYKDGKPVLDLDLSGVKVGSYLDFDPFYVPDSFYLFLGWVLMVFGTLGSMFAEKTRFDEDPSLMLDQLERTVKRVSNVGERIAVVGTVVDYLAKRKNAGMKERVKVIAKSKPTLARSVVGATHTKFLFKQLIEGIDSVEQIVGVSNEEKIRRYNALVDLADLLEELWGTKMRSKINIRLNGLHRMLMKK